MLINFITEHKDFGIFCKHIGKGAELKYVILDKNVTVTPGAKLIGTRKNPIIVKRGETV